MSNTQKKIFSLFIILFFLIASIILQVHLFLNWDVRWLLLMTQKWLHGGHYYTDFVDTNPPTVLYFYLPIVLAKLHLNLSWRFLVYIYLILIGFISLAVIQYLVSKIFSDNNKFQLVLFFVLGFVYFILPHEQFAQREHFIFLLILPYLFLLTARLKNINIPFGLIFLTAVLAAMGFSVKPYFILVFISLEIFYFSRTRKILSFFKMENIIIGFILLFALISILFFFKDFTEKLLPLLWKLYYLGYAVSWHELVLAYPSIFIWGTCLVYFICRKFFDQRDFLDLLVIAALASFTCFLWERIGWFYQIYPAASFALLLSSVMLYQFFFLLQKKFSWRLGISLFLNIIFLLIILSDCVSLYGVYFQASNAFLHQDPVIKFLNQHIKNKKVFVFSTSVSSTYVALNFVPFQSVSRSSSLFLLPGLVKLQLQTKTIGQKKEFIPYQKKVFQMVYEDLLKKPQWLMVDVSPEKVHLENIPLNYFAYFSQDSRIRSLLKKYHYVATVENYSFYEKNYSHLGIRCTL